MRPTYLDVLTKTIPSAVFPANKTETENNNQGSMTVSSKNLKTKTKSTTLKRQNSSGSDEHESLPKTQQT